MGRRVHPQKRSMSWVNSVLRQFLSNSLVAGPGRYTQHVNSLQSWLASPRMSPLQACGSKTSKGCGTRTSEDYLSYKSLVPRAQRLFPLVWALKLLSRKMSSEGCLEVESWMLAVKPKEHPISFQAITFTTTGTEERRLMYLVPAPSTTL